LHVRGCVSETYRRPPVVSTAGAGDPRRTSRITCRFPPPDVSSNKQRRALNDSSLSVSAEPSPDAGQPACSTLLPERVPHGCHPVPPRFFLSGLTGADSRGSRGTGRTEN